MPCVYNLCTCEAQTVKKAGSYEFLDGAEWLVLLDGRVHVQVNEAVCPRHCLLRFARGVRSLAALRVVKQWARQLIVVFEHIQMERFIVKIKMGRMEVKIL